MTGYTVEAAGSGPPDFVWMDAAALKAHAVPSAFARYYAEAVKMLEAAEQEENHVVLEKE